MASPVDPALLVIFDCDGVLVNSETLSHAVLRDMLQELGATLTLQQTLHHFMGTSTQKCQDVATALVGRPLPPSFMEDFRLRTFAAFGQSLQPVAGVPELLQTLAWPCCVASNGPRQKMQFTLGHTGLLHHFEQRLFSADDVARPKPAPDLFLHAAQQLGFAAQACVVVEDSPTGVAAARAAGMRCLGFAAMTEASRLWAAGVEQVFSDMRELPSLLQVTFAARP